MFFGSENCKGKGKGEGKVKVKFQESCKNFEVGAVGNWLKILICFF